MKLSSRQQRKIKQAFQWLGIILKADFINSKECVLPDSITNQFIKVQDIHGVSYLIRINGKLWPPFTRKQEDHNLSCLNQHGVGTQVLLNDEENGFQICCLDKPENRFNEIKKRHTTCDVLKMIGKQIRRIHDVKGCKNSYTVSSTLIHSHQKISTAEQDKLLFYYLMVLRILTLIGGDKINYVFAHNDLLASSIYCHKDQIKVVDWEYSGANHRSYDLAYFAIKSCLTLEEEKSLMASYDPNNNFNTQYYFSLMKPVISLLLLQWDISAKRNHCINQSYQALVRHTNDLLLMQPIKKTLVAFNAIHARNNQNTLNLLKSKL